MFVASIIRSAVSNLGLLFRLIDFRTENLLVFCRNRRWEGERIVAPPAHCMKMEQKPQSEMLSWPLPHENRIQQNFI